MLENLRLRLVAAGLQSLSPTAFIVFTALLSAVITGLVLAIIGLASLAFAAGAASALVPWLLLSWRIKVRRRARRTVWPDLIDHLISAVRSGQSLAESIGSLSQVGPHATRSAFTQFETDYRATSSFSYSVDQLKERLSDPVADRILETLRMAREVGGTELTTILRSLTASLREESALRSEVEARQSWVVNAARLGVAAPWVVLVLLTTRPEAAHAYNSATGTTIIMCGLIVSVIAYRVMVALGRLPEERRWFQ